jgi:hypothetical protein
MAQLRVVQDFEAFRLKVKITSFALSEHPTQQVKLQVLQSPDKPLPGF